MENPMGNDVLDVLNALAGSGLMPRRPKELCKRLNIPRSTMSRHLRRLVKAGWARRLGSGCYVMGEGVFRAVAVIEELYQIGDTHRSRTDVLERDTPKAPGPEKDAHTIAVRVEFLKRRLMRMVHDRIDQFEDEVRELLLGE